MTDLLIIGGGMAGLTAAIYALRAGKSVLLTEKETFGGQITSAPRVENYPGMPGVSGNQLTDAALSQALDLGLEIELEDITSLHKLEDGSFIASTSKREYAAKAVILATGAKHRPLGVAREEELTGHGVSYCALCDGAFHKGEDVAVVGGGNSAAQAASRFSGRSVQKRYRHPEFRSFHLRSARSGRHARAGEHSLLPQQPRNRAGRRRAPARRAPDPRAIGRGDRAACDRAVYLHRPHGG